MFCYRTKSNHQVRIEKFMELAGQKVPKNPTLPDFDTRKLRAKLILEEAIETISALGFCVCIDGKVLLNKDNVELSIIHNKECSVAEIAHECADLSVVTIGTISACGVADESVLEEIDRANLSKVTGKVEKNEDGKVVKPKDFKPADIGKVIEMQIEEVEINKQQAII